MDGGKRRAGRDPAVVALAFGLPGQPLTYDQFVQLYLNAEWARATRVTEAADAVRLGTDGATVPDGWIDLLVDDPRERVRWKLNEFRKA